MGNVIVGLLCLGAVAGFILLAFRNSLPLKARTDKQSEINKHSTHGDTQVGHGSNTGHWSMWGDPGPDQGIGEEPTGRALPLIEVRS